MIRLVALLLVMLACAGTAKAADDARPFAQVPLLPATERLPDDVEAFVRALWPDYYETAELNAFHRDNLRLGRIDLDGDNRAELVLMVDAVGWDTAAGYPFVIAQWRKNRWIAVGWGWGDEDTLFATTEVVGGWRSLDSGTMALHWIGKEYRAEEKSASAP